MAEETAGGSGTEEAGGEAQPAVSAGQPVASPSTLRTSSSGQKAGGPGITEFFSPKKPSTAYELGILRPFPAAAGGVLSTTEQLEDSDPTELEERTAPTVSVTPIETLSNSPASELLAGKNEDEEMLPVL